MGHNGPMTEASAYSTLLSPLQVGHMTLRNRVVMGSMHVGLEDRSKDIPDLAAYFAERAKGGTALIVTGGYAPNVEGWLLPAGSLMATRRMADKHRRVTDAVHEEDGRIVLQVLHAGRYGYQPFVRSASSTKSPISKFKARALSGRGVERTIDAYVRAAQLAKRAGYDGIEIMGSEGYLINQFLAARTNDRTDKWGGSASNRMRFPEEIVRRTRAMVGDDFALMYRMSLLDLVDNAQTWDETAELATRLEAAGVDVFNTGIGWHEARIPTIVTSVPRAAFSWVTGKLKDVVDVPVCASNRINDPDVAEGILSRGEADLVSMARPLLADPFFVEKTRQGRTDEINICIACNQACLDHTFTGKKASCLVNPRAGRERDLVLLPVPTAGKPRIAVIGAGVAGMACAEAAASRGMHVEVFEASGEVGGQFRLAMQVPGKEEFRHSLAYFRRRLEVLGVEVHLNRRVEASDLEGYDHIVVATGVTPRIPSIPGVDHEKVMTYAQLLSGERTAGDRVAVMGAGGIGFDVSEYLVADPDQTLEEWNAQWGVVDPAVERGGLGKPRPHAPKREVHLLQRKESALGKGLGKTSGWVHRATLKQAGVQEYRGVSYDRIDDEGLHITVGGESKVLEVDTVVLCTGQESVRDLAEVEVPGATVHVIGGADVAAELDAKRAIKQGVELAASF